MTSEKIKKHSIRRLIIVTIPIYLLIDIIIWNVALFFIYGRSIPHVYGVKIIFSVVAFIFFFKYLRMWNSNLDFFINARILYFF